MHPQRDRPLTPLVVGSAVLVLLALIGVVLATDDRPGPRPEAPPADMLRIDEGASFVVPLRKVLGVNGIVTRADWSGSTPVVIRFDGETVFWRSLFAGDAVAVPPGLAATAGTVVEIDRLSAAADSRVTLLAYLSDVP